MCYVLLFLPRAGIWSERNGGESGVTTLVWTLRTGARTGRCLCRRFLQTLSWRRLLIFVEISPHGLLASALTLVEIDHLDRAQ
jgi:predicted amidohydrolase